MKRTKILLSINTILVLITHLPEEYFFAITFSELSILGSSALRKEVKVYDHLTVFLLRLQILTIFMAPFSKTTSFEIKFGLNNSKRKLI